MSITKAAIALDVERGLAVRKEMDRLKAELEEIEERLEAAGLEGEQIELNDPDREGRQFLARSADHIVPVVFTADLLIKSFAEGSKHHKRILDSFASATAAPKLIAEFYQREISHKAKIESGKQFRAKADELLDKAAPAFITACLQRDKHGIPKSAIKIEWDRASEVTNA